MYIYVVSIYILRTVADVVIIELMSNSMTVNLYIL